MIKTADNSIDIKKLMLKNKRSIRNRRLVMIIVAVLMLFTFFVFAAILFLDNHLLTISAVKPGMGKKGIALSESAGFENPLSMLATGDNIKLDHYTYSWLPFDIADRAGGDHGEEEKFVAFTFYLKNTADEPMDYNMIVTVKNITKGIDEAIRIMVILNGERTVYAKPVMGTAEPEWITGPADEDREKYGYSTPFKGGGLAADRMREGLEAQGIDKYTIVVWIEGEDPECVNSILDGKLKIDVKFTVIEQNAE